MKALFALLAAFALLFAGCAATGAQNRDGKNGTGNGPEKNQTEIANPASVFCAEKGYALEIRKAADGSESGWCVFPNGRECEEWAFMRGTCTDADSFEFVQHPGYVANPVASGFKFHADGRFVMTVSDLRAGNATVLEAWKTPAEFAAFAKTLAEGGFEGMEGRYDKCDGAGCPSDMPGATFTLVRQGAEKSVYVYMPAQRPELLDNAAAQMRSIAEKSEFVDVTDSGCKLYKEGRADVYNCFGCPKGITNPKCSEPRDIDYPVDDEGTGSCAVGADGSCQYQPPAEMTEKLCKAWGGNWNACGSACRGSPEGTICTLQCVQYCECGGFAGFSCPDGYFCSDYLPKGAADAMGICKRAA